MFSLTYFRWCSVFIGYWETLRSYLKNPENIEGLVNHRQFGYLKSQAEQ